MRINEDLIIGNTGLSLEQVETNTTNITNLQAVTLYDGGGVAKGNVTLNKGLSNFKYFEVFGRFYDSYYTACFGIRFDVSEALNRRIQIPGGRASGEGCVIYQALYDVTENSLNFTSFGQINCTTSGNQSKTDGSIAIHKVVGYKTR